MLIPLYMLVNQIKKKLNNMSNKSDEFYIVAKKYEDIDIDKLHHYAQWSSIDSAYDEIKERCSDYGFDKDDFKVVRVNINLFEVS